MNTYPEGRFVKLHNTAGADARPYFAVYLSATGTPTIANHGLLAEIDQTDPARAKLIEDRLGELVARNDQFFTWLEANAANAILFMEDPVRALREALPGLPSDFFDGWKA